MRELGFAWHERFTVTDELTGATYDWGQHSAFRLNPSCSLGFVSHRIRNFAVAPAAAAGQTGRTTV
jgi:starch synthase (maltosyl-transferring)